MAYDMYSYGYRKTSTRILERKIGDKSKGGNYSNLSKLFVVPSSAGDPIGQVVVPYPSSTVC